MKFITNGTITATDTPETILAEGHNLTTLVLSIEGDGVAVRYMVGEAAGVAKGELIYSSAGVGSATITALTGQLISVYGPQDTPWSIRQAA
jgi:hypothetical protein